MAAPTGNLLIVESSDESDDNTKSTSGHTDEKAAGKSGGSSGNNGKKGNKKHRKQKESREPQDAVHLEGNTKESQKQEKQREGRESRDTVQPEGNTGKTQTRGRRKGKEQSRTKDTNKEHNQNAYTGPTGQDYRYMGPMNFGNNGQQGFVPGINPQQSYQNFRPAPPPPLMSQPPFMPAPQNFAGDYLRPGMGGFNNQYGGNFNRPMIPNQIDGQGYSQGNYTDFRGQNAPFSGHCHFNQQSGFPSRFQGGVPSPPGNPGGGRGYFERGGSKSGRGYHNSQQESGHGGNSDRGRGAERSRGTRGRGRGNSGRGNIRNKDKGNDVGQEGDGADKRRTCRTRNREEKGRRHGVRSGDQERTKGRKPCAEDESDALKIDVQDVFQFLLKECKAFISYEKFLEKCSLFPGDADVERWFYKNRSFFRMFYKNGKIIYLSTRRSDVKMCLHYKSKQGCSNENCGQLHICADFVRGWCQQKESCQFNHSFLNDGRNPEIIERLGLSAFSNKEIANILKWQNPQLCPDTKTPCKRGEKCPYLHMCSHFMLRNACKYGTSCKLGHSFDTEHNKWILKTFRMEDWPNDQRKRRMMNKLLLIPKFPPRERRTEEEEKEEEEDLEGHDSDVTYISDDGMSVFSDQDFMTETMSVGSGDTSGSSDEYSESDRSNEDDDEEIEEEVYSRKGRFVQDPSTDMDYLSDLRYMADED